MSDLFYFDEIMSTDGEELDLYFPNQVGNVKVMSDIVEMLKNCGVKHMISFFRKGGTDGTYTLRVHDADEQMKRTCVQLARLQYNFENQ